jgi:hypothetical protein
MSPLTPRTIRGSLSCAAVVLMSAAAQPVAQQKSPRRNPPAQSNRVIKSRVDLVTSDVIVRDAKGQFISDLTKDDFDVYEDHGQREETEPRGQASTRVLAQTSTREGAPLEITYDG